MKLPTLQDLQHVTSLLWKEDFLNLDDTRKLKIIEIAQQGILAAVIDDIALNINIGLAETIAEGNLFKPIVEQLEEIDKSLGPIMEWFEKSRLYEP